MLGNRSGTGSFSRKDYLQRCANASVSMHDNEVRE